MALTPATGLADYASGISTAALQVNSDTGQVSIGTDSPTTARLRVGTAITMSVGVITATDAVFRGNVSIAGTLTYEDVTSIDSVGVLTARSGVRIPAGGLTVAGVSSFSSALDVNAELDVDGQTDLDNLIVAGVSTFSSSIDLNGELDVDGQTDLDTLQVAGVSTFSSSIDLNGELDVDGQTDLDNLIVAGVSTFSADVSIADKIIHTGDTNTAIRFPAADTVTVETGGSERVRVTSDGRVGVGTEDPGSPLEVNGGSALDVATFNSHHADGPLINVQRSGTAIGFVGSGKNLHSTTGSVDALSIRSQAEFTIATGGSTEKLRVTSAGSVGIGVTNPIAFGPTLQVSGTDPALLLQDTATAVDYFGINIASGAVNTWYDDASAFVIHTASAISGAGLEEKLRITSSGLIGINENNPGHFIDMNIGSTNIGIKMTSIDPGAYIQFVDNNTSSENSIGALGDILQFKTGGSERVRIDGSGRIAQGGRTPTSHGSPNLLLWGSDTTLHITSTGSTNNTSFAGIKFAVAGASTGDYSKAGIFVQRQDSYNDLDMIFAFRSTNDADGVAISDEKLRIDSSGKVGIGQTNPQGNLHIGNVSGSENLIMHAANNGDALIRFREGGISTSGFNEYSIGMDGGRNSLVVNGQGFGEIIAINGDTGFVGIGTVTPNEELHIHANGTSYVRFTDESSGTGATDGLVIGLDSSHTYVWNYEAGDFVVATSAAEKLRVTSGGLLIQNERYSRFINNSSVSGSATRTLTITALRYGTATIHFGGSDGNGQYVHFKINLGGQMWGSGNGYNAEVSSSGYVGGSYSVTKNNTSYVIQVTAGSNPMYYSYTFESTSYTGSGYAAIAET